MAAPVVVVGAGAAGLVAAWRAALAGRETLLLEANPREGAKIRISGAGKCNVTHDGPLRELLAAFPVRQARFLRPAVHAFSNADVVELLRREGVDTYVRPDGRVFPLDAPGSARLVVEALRGMALRAGVDIRTLSRVEGLIVEGRRILGVRVAGERLDATAVVLATGGASYPRIGTRGEAIGWLKELGLPVKPWFPALAPIPLKEPRPDWEGVPFRGGELRLRAKLGGRILARSAGDILFTRTGISGPAALDLSESVEIARRGGGAGLDYAFFKEASAAEADFLAANPGVGARRWLMNWLPERAAADRIARLGLPAEVRLHQLGREPRKALANELASFSLGEAGAVPLERGEVSAGGLHLDAVDPGTLRVRNWENLHVCGELLDLNGPVGGYNLQAAFSTGFLAGSHA